MCACVQRGESVRLHGYGCCALERSSASRFGCTGSVAVRVLAAQVIVFSAAVLPPRVLCLTAMPYGLGRRLRNLIRQFRCIAGHVLQNYPEVNSALVELESTVGEYFPIGARSEGRTGRRWGS